MALIVRRVTDEADLEKMTGWMHGWWGPQEGYCHDAVRVYLARGIHSQTLPQTYGMYLDGRLIGMYQFTRGDLFVRPDLSPWLANVYVDEPFRKGGYGRQMLSTVLENARANLQTDAVYLYTSHQGLYEKFGWTFVEEVDTFLKPRMQRLYRLDLTDEKGVLNA